MNHPNPFEVEKTKLKIGPYQICPIPTGQFGLDGGAMFGTVPKVLWERSNPTDEKNRIEMEARALLLKSSGLNILIDTGNGHDFVAKYGEKLGHKFAEMYAIDDSGPSLLKSLALQGVKAEDIHHVILTHLHFDHAGGATTDVGGKLVPTFPKAQYWVQKGNLETARKPNLRERASYYAANFQPLIDSGVLKVVEGPHENFLPGVSSIISNGHTQSQQIIRVTDGKTTLLYCGDMVPTSSHVKIPWLMGYDLYPLTLMEEKQKYLSEAADQSWYLFFEHDPYCDAALIERNGHDFAVQRDFGFNTLKSVCKDTLQQIRDGELQLVAASLAFSTAMALVPFIAVVLATFQSIGGLEALYPKVEIFLLRNLREAAGGDVTKFIRIFLKNINAGKMGTTGAILLFLTSLRLLYDMEVGIHRVWNVKNSRPFFKRFIYHWALILAIPMFLAVYVGFTTLEQFKFAHHIMPATISNTLVLVGCLFSTYKFVPNVRVRAAPALVSAVLTALVIYGAHKTFTALVIKSFSYNKIYGSFAALPVLLLWILTMWYVILAGVALSASLQKRRIA